MEEEHAKVLPQDLLGFIEEQETGIIHILVSAKLGRLPITNLQLKFHPRLFPMNVP